MSIKILIADKHGIVREGIRFLIEKQPDMETVGIAEDSLKAIQMSQEFKPDIVIMDISFLNLKINGTETIKQIIRQNPETKIIALSMHTNSTQVSEMIKAGASGYMLQDYLFSDLSEAIHLVNDGGVYFSPFILSLIVNDYLSWLSNAGGLNLESLTKKENEILKLLGEGENTKQIAQKLQVSIESIEKNRRQIIQKLNNNNLSEIAVQSILGGLSSLEINKMI